ncbi:Heterokaryon incompatibility protein 6 OR allele [Lachnellula suecica]|uniref:Heterokaryon incompatibility protein 6 OR allele n=1 Tax=Lachnellula suecica TaxID=602035 RepID=A0A8T9C5U3_9HELO|nr:Heterokaryon incompatibility protein 6 OR allele [Lachnellula suecica]
MAKFHYEPLDTSSQEIRLVTLAPRLSSGALRCKLNTVLFTSMPQYEALSYTWVEDTQKNEILLQDKSFMVSDNLWLALKELSHPTERRVLWIDFVCINQDDVAEKNHQVKKMGEIYSKASRVIAWLGEADSSSDALFTALNQPGSLSRSQFWTENLSGREYWPRLWIIQELGLASRILVQCGSSSVEWEVLHPWFGVESLTHRIHAVRETRRTGYCPLARLLENFADSRCQDPKDLVYGFLGLATDPSIGDLPIDYSKSIPEMYADLILWANKSDKLDLAAFSELVQGVLSPFYSMHELQNWYNSGASPGQMVQLVGRESAPWEGFNTDTYELGTATRVKQPLRPNNSASSRIRLYATEAEGNWAFLKGIQPQIIVKAPSEFSSSMGYAQNWSDGFDVHDTPTHGDQGFRFRGCDFSLVVQAAREPLDSRRGAFIARDVAHHIAPTPFQEIKAPTTFGKGNLASWQNPGHRSEASEQQVSPAEWWLSTDRTDPKNTYASLLDMEIGPEFLFEMDICSFQMITNQRRSWRRTN